MSNYKVKKSSVDRYNEVLGRMLPVVNGDYVLYSAVEALQSQVEKLQVENERLQNVLNSLNSKYQREY